MSSCERTNKKDKSCHRTAYVACLNRALPIKLKMHLMQNINSKSLEYEVVLYFDLQPHPRTRALGSVLALQGAYF